MTSVDPALRAARGGAALGLAAVRINAHLTDAGPPGFQAGRDPEEVPVGATVPA